MVFTGGSTGGDARKFPGIPANFPCALPRSPLVVTSECLRRIPAGPAEHFDVPDDPLAPLTPPELEGNGAPVGTPKTKADMQKWAEEIRKQAQEAKK